MGKFSCLSDQVHLRFTATERHNLLDLRTLPSRGELAASRVHAIPDQEGLIRSLFVQGKLVSGGRLHQVSVRVNLADPIRAQRVVWAADLLQADWDEGSAQVSVQKVQPILASGIRRAV